MPTIVCFELETRDYTKVVRDEPDVSEEVALAFVDGLNAQAKKAAFWWGVPPFGVRVPDMPMVLTGSRHIPDAAEAVARIERFLNAVLGPLARLAGWLLALSCGTALFMVPWHFLARGRWDPSDLLMLLVPSCAFCSLPFFDWAERTLCPIRQRLMERWTRSLTGPLLEVVGADHERKRRKWLAEQQAAKRRDQEEFERMLAEGRAMLRGEEPPE